MRPFPLCGVRSRTEVIRGKPSKWLFSLVARPSVLLGLSFSGGFLSGASCTSMRRTGVRALLRSTGRRRIRGKGQSATKSRFRGSAEDSGLRLLHPVPFDSCENASERVLYDALGSIALEQGSVLRRCHSSGGQVSASQKRREGTTVAPKITIAQ